MSRQTDTGTPMEKLEIPTRNFENGDPPLNFKPFPLCDGSRHMALLPKTYTYPIIFFYIFVKTIIMKDYNSIPFKNKAIDRLTRNTTIVPGTQIKEVKVTPSAQQVDNYVNKSDKKFNENMDKWEGLWYAGQEAETGRYSKEYLEDSRDKISEESKSRRENGPKYVNTSPSISQSREALKKSEVGLANAKEDFDYGYNRAPFRKMDAKQATLSQRDQSNDKLVDSRPYKKTPAYKADKAKAAKKPKLDPEERFFASVMGGLVGTAGYSILDQMNIKSKRKERRDNNE